MHSIPGVSKTSKMALLGWWSTLARSFTKLKVENTHISINIRGCTLHFNYKRLPEDNTHLREQVCFHLLLQQMIGEQKLQRAPTAADKG